MKLIDSVCVCAVLVLRSVLMTLAILCFCIFSPAAAQVTIEEIRTISPKAKFELAHAIVEAQSDLETAGINNSLRMAHFIAQVMTETGGLLRIDENMKYSVKGLLKTFSRKTISETKAQELAGKSQEIANWVYGARLGNRGRHTGDGWLYRGSGYIQLTGRNNFHARGVEISMPLRDNPDLARTLPAALKAAIAYWEARDINRAADDNDHRRVRVLVNGPAAHGLPAAKIWFERAWTRVFRAKAGAEAGTFEVADESALYDDLLIENGLLSTEAFELGAEAQAAAREEAIREFQRSYEGIDENGDPVTLPESGQLDEATMEALLDPANWRYENLDVSAAAPATQTEQTASFLLDISPGDSLSPEPGSGQAAAQIDLPRDEIAALAIARPMYSDYEMGDAAAEPETFQPFSVILPDDRTVVPNTTEFPARAIVQILFRNSTGGRSLCSGAMIAPDTVLTAAHCLHSGRSGGTAYSDFSVTPGRNELAAPFGRCRGREIFVLQGWITAATVAESRYYDLGALKLDCDIGRRTGWLGVRTLGPEEGAIPTTVQGYAGDRAPPGIQWVSEDNLRVLWELKGFYRNDTFGGTSGSPVVATGAETVVIGVHTNGLHGVEEPWKSHNAFTRITPQRLALIRSWTQQ